MIGRITLSVVAAGVGLLLAVPVWAHHAFGAEFDVNKPLKLRGTVTKWEMINPHSWIHLDVKEPDGKVASWMIEGGSPNSLLRLGFTRNSLPPGTEIIVEGYRAKDGANPKFGQICGLIARNAYGKQRNRTATSGCGRIAS